MHFLFTMSDRLGQSNCHHEKNPLWQRKKLMLLNKNGAQRKVERCLKKVKNRCSVVKVGTDIDALSFSFSVGKRMLNAQALQT